MFTSIELANFKAIKSASIDLEPFTVMVGPNGSGKSTVLQATQILCDLTRAPKNEFYRNPIGRVAHIFSNFFEPTRIRTKGQMGELRFSGSLSGDRELGLAISILNSSPSEVDHYKLWYEADATAESLELRPGVHVEARSFFERLEESIQLGAVLLKLEANKLASPSPFSWPTMDDTGFGLATELAGIASEYPELRESIEHDLAQIVPRARRIRMPRARYDNQSEPGLTVEVEFDGAGFIPADMLSEGTLLALGVLLAAHRPGTSALLIDDIDRGLHPQAQSEVIARLADVQRQKPELQILCTSHSPYLLDNIPPDQVRVMGADERGHVECRRLTEHPDWTRWRGILKAGEFWSSVGEDWILGGVARGGG